MGNTTIDLYSIRFWYVVGIAILVLLPLKHPFARRSLLSLINVGVLVLLMRDRVVAVLLGILVTWTFLHFMSDKRRGRVFSVLGAVIALSLFIQYKLPRPSEAYESSQINPILAAVGFSYVFLRLVEVGRAVHEGRHRPPDLASLVNYLLPFHMLAAGPIQSYDEFIAQPAIPPAPGFTESLSAVERIAGGLFKKFILADLIQRIFLTGLGAGWPYLFLEIQLNYLWLFLDFSAYSDVAVGIGRLIGVATPENFNRPYLARNIVDFWDRWHISLSQFIRRNLYIPIQLSIARRAENANPILISSFAFSVSFVLCGLWHQFNWRWVVWGLSQAGGLIVCNVYKDTMLKRVGRKGLNRYLANPWIRPFATLLTFEYVAVSMAFVTIPLERIWGAT